ncbi:MAG TPA: S-adenosylmethionine:tRNA ribosyltransferase-isomerase [Acidimicrobiales bacterium]
MTPAASLVGGALGAGPLDFVLPPGLEAHEPPEARGVARDGVRLLVAAGGRMAHSVASALPGFLEPGDLLVVNLSSTLAAAVEGMGDDGRPLAVHFSGPHPGGGWVVELRGVITAGASAAFAAADAGEVVRLPAGARLRLVEPEAMAPGMEAPRLWRADLDQPGLRSRVGRRSLSTADDLARVGGWLAQHGAPIRYAHVPRPWPLSAYQTVFARVPGSAEMPSAGRPFTAALLAALAARGVGVAPVVLHAGVSSQEAGEGPLTEPFAVPGPTAERVNDAHRRGHRVVAVGTTVVRALESAVGSTGAVEARRGWTDLVVTPDRGVGAVDGLVTGWHEPRASHLALLEAIAGRPLLEASYRAALAEGYLWHELGDLHLILPPIGGRQGAVAPR